MKSMGGEHDPEVLEMEALIDDLAERLLPSDNYDSAIEAPNSISIPEATVEDTLMRRLRLLVLNQRVNNSRMRRAERLWELEFWILRLDNTDSIRSFEVRCYLSSLMSRVNAGGRL